MMRAFGVIAIVAMGCASSESELRSDHRYVNTAQHYSVDLPDGWTTATDRGSTKFSPSTGMRVIVIRSARRPPELHEGRPATTADIVAATQQVLRAMPGAIVGDPQRLEVGGLAGVRISVTFEPKGQAATYRRTHVVLFGTNYLFHIIEVGPASEPTDEAAFADVVRTLKEEG